MNATSNIGKSAYVSVTRQRFYISSKFEVRSSNFEQRKRGTEIKMSLVKHKACPCPVDGASYVPGVKHFLNQNDTQDIAGFV